MDVPGGRVMADEHERLIGMVEQLPDGIWRATYRVRVQESVFTEGGETEVFVTEMQATKWLHAQAAKRCMPEMEIRRKPLT